MILIEHVMQSHQQR